MSKRYPKQVLSARFMPDSVVVAESGEVTADITWSTGAQVRRYDWWEDTEFIEELSMKDGDVDLSRLNSGAPFLADHRQSIGNVIGVVEKAWLEDGTGRATVRFSKRDEVAPIAKDVQDGVLRNISVGYQIREFEKIEQDEDLPIYRAVDWLPMEISLVAIGADAGAQVRADTSEFSNVIVRGEDMTDSVNTPTEADETESVTTTDEQNRSASADKAAERALEDAKKNERKRIADIREFGRIAGADEKVINGYIERGISAQTAKEEMLRKWSEETDKSIGTGHVEAGEAESDKRNDAAVNAIMAKAGVLQGKERAEKLQGNPFVGWRMTDFARDCAERAGVKTGGMSQMDIVGRAFTQSTSDFPVILENTMHKTVVAAYAVAADTWRRWCRVGSVSDFRAHKRIRFGTIGNLDALNELGEFKNKEIPDGEAESVTASTRGNLINISRQAMINDDVGYFIGLSQMLGRAAARTIEAQAYAKLVSNPTMSDGIALFHADHGNLAASGAAPTVETVSAGEDAMALQTDINGNDYLDIAPSIALCPRSLRRTFAILNTAEYNPDNAPGDTSGKNTMEPNTVRGAFDEVIGTPRLSGSAWYLLADPAEAPVIEVVFLDGNDQPFIDMEEGFSVDGAKYKVRLDFGVDAVGYVGGYKNAGS